MTTGRPGKTTIDPRQYRTLHGVDVPVSDALEERGGKWTMLNTPDHTFEALARGDVKGFLSTQPEPVVDRWQCLSVRKRKDTRTFPALEL
ncbi:hypothetical protein AB4Y45_43535 [Paraburkholderia sp. EG287A]|uniref:hypothetical protein n=1 Tax=unclassified Paraburkholderia TaxID=2615204 RepID=UPI0034D2BE62